MADLALIRTGLKNNLNTISGLQAYATVPAKTTPPCAIVEPDSPLMIRQAMQKGVIQLNFRVVILVAAVASDTAQKTLDAYLNTSDAGSVWAAIESDRTLGGAASDCAVQEVSTYGDIVWNDIAFWGSELKVAVLATG